MDEARLFARADAEKQRNVSDLVRAHTMARFLVLNSWFFVRCSLFFGLRVRGRSSIMETGLHRTETRS